MGKSRLIIDEEMIRKLIAEGRGQNEGVNYKPWLNARDVPSKGFSSRGNGWKTDRPHQLFSTPESQCCDTFDWSKIIVDIREQYPLLPLESTLLIAETLDIKHPVHPRTARPIVLTTDFLLTVVYDGQRCEQARTVKLSIELSKKRTLEKFEIERLYWKARNIPWGIITEREIPAILAHNVDFIHDRYHRENLALSFDEICDIALILTKSVSGTTIALRHATQACDRQLGFEPGTSLKVAYHLIARRYWHIDMDKPINPGEPLVLLGENLKALYEEGK